MAPFWFDDKNLEIEEEQYDDWEKSDGLKLLSEHFEHIIRVKKVKHFDINTDLPDWYYKVYNTILDRSNAERWFKVIPDAFVLNLEDKKYLEEVKKYDLTKSKDGWFVKTGTCSTKNEYPPEPVFSIEEAITHLSDSSKVKKSIKNGTAKCLLFRPWIKEINDSNEIRVFVRNCKVVGVSQQSCYHMIPFLNMLNADNIIEEAQKCFDKFNNALEIKKRYNYQCTFDAYITGDINVELIEINSEMFGWGPAGSSLFSWKYNPPPKCDEPAKFLIAGSF
jgi:hypothetical protein